MALELPVARHAGAHQFETQRGQELGDAPATFVLSRLNVNLSKRRILRAFALRRQRSPV